MSHGNKLALALSLVLVLAGVARPQDRPPEDLGREIAPIESGTAVVDSTAKTNPLEALLIGSRMTGRDPFSTSQKFAEAAGGPRFVPGTGPLALPRLSLRGYVELRDRSSVALIEVEGQGVYVVRAGDTIGVTLAGRTQVLRVQAIDSSSARVEAGSLGQVLVVR